MTNYQFELQLNFSFEKISLIDFTELKTHCNHDFAFKISK